MWVLSIQVVARAVIFDLVEVATPTHAVDGSKPYLSYVSGNEADSRN
jgi:hypothetical protein